MIARHELDDEIAYWREARALLSKTAPGEPPQAWVERAAEIIIDEIGGAPDGLGAAWDAALRIYRLAREPDTRGEANPAPLQERERVIEECATSLEAKADFWDDIDDPDYASAYRQCAADVRALLALSPAPGGG